MWQPLNLPKVEFYYLDRMGWPLEVVKSQPLRKFIRRLLHTRKITTNRWDIKEIDYSVYWTQPEMSKMLMDQISLGRWLILPTKPWPRPEMVGLVDAGNDTSEMMKPEEDK